MRIIWELAPAERAQVRAFVDSQRDNAFVRYRISHNVDNPPTSVALDDFWERLVGALLSSQQRSGPDSPVARLQRTEPFALSYGFCATQGDLEAAIRDVVQSHKGIRFYNRIAGYLVKDFAALDEGLWVETKDVIEMLIGQDSPEQERRTAEFIRDNYYGLGPKQSRNLLRGLGLTRYEIPIDSRITRWLNDFRFPVHLSAGGLADPYYYNFVSDGVQALCRQSGILPCVFDAAVFSSYDEGWTKENVIW